MAKSKNRVSEFTSYIYIKNELSTLGWNTKNPSRNSNGQVYTQQECLNHEEIQKQLINKKPEYVVKISEDNFYIIEAKGSIDDIDKAFEEALDYADLINKSKIIKGCV